MSADVSLVTGLIPFLAVSGGITAAIMTALVKRGRKRPIWAHVLASISLLVLIVEILIVLVIFWIGSQPNNGDVFIALVFLALPMVAVAIVALLLFAQAMAAGRE